MPQDVRLWIDDDSDGQLKPVSAGTLDLESRLEEWIERDISLVDEDLLLIGRQVGTDYGGVIDLLAGDARGDLVLLELKRDRTPRHVTAQALDYASWVADLSREQIEEIALRYLSGRALEEAYLDHFGTGLPETVNSEHRILIVSSEIDAGSERIIELSEGYGVNINAATFQYFRLPGGKALLDRVFLLEPEKVERKARTKGRSKQKPNLTSEELKDLARERGIGDLYEEAVALLGPVFNGTRRTRSSISFLSDFRGGRRATVNLVPEESSPEDGLRFQIYALRAAEHFGVKERQIEEVLPPSSEEWRYTSEGSAWEDFAGYFSSPGEIERLTRLSA